MKTDSAAIGYAAERLCSRQCYTEYDSVRAVLASDVLADARMLHLEARHEGWRVTLLRATDNKPVAIVSSAFAMLE